MFSVLLALGLNEWRQGAADRRLVARVMETVRGEITANRSTIRGRLGYHETMRDSTQSFLMQHMVEGGSGLLVGRTPEPSDIGFNPELGLATAGRLGQTGWELALRSGSLQHMEYDLMVALSRVYAAQDEVEAEEVRLLERLDGVSAAFFGEREVGSALLLFSSTLTDLVLREQELLTAYRAALELAGE